MNGISTSVSSEKCDNSDIIDFVRGLVLVIVAVVYYGRGERSVDDEPEVVIADTVGRLGNSAVLEKV